MFLRLQTLQKRVSEIKIVLEQQQQQQKYIKLFAHTYMHFTLLIKASQSNGLITT